MNTRTWFVLFCVALPLVPLQAQPHPQTEQTSPALSEHTQMDHTGMDHAIHGATTRSAGDVALPPPTTAALAAAFPPLRHRAAHAPPLVSLVRIDRLETWNADPGRGHAWATQAWIGSDIQRLWLRSQGECYGGRCQSVAVDMLYGHDISPWWDALIGARRDEQPDGRTWAALGVQGVTPYKFESAAFLYLSGAAMRLMVETKYDLLLSQRLILQPSLQATAGLTRDRDLGAGPQTLQVGVRMRYQITRRVAPYVGWEREYGYGGVGARHAGVVPLTMKSAGWLGYAAGFERSCPVKHHNQ